MRNRLLLSLLAPLAAFSLIACTGGDAEPASSVPSGPPLEITLGVAQSQSGPAATYGKSVINGVLLASKEISADTAAGVRITPVVVDDQSTVDGGKAAFSGLVGQKVHAIIGPTLSNAAPAAHSLAQQAGIPVLAATNTAPGITDTGDYIFRTALAESVVVPHTIEVAATRVNLANTVLFEDGNDAFSRGSATAMRRGMTVIPKSAIVREVDVATGDISAAVAALKDSPAPSAFLVSPLYETSAKILTALRAAGYQQPVIGGNSFNTLDITRLAGTAVEGAFVGAQWNPGVSGNASQRFIAAYKSEYGVEPDLFAAQGYVATHLLADALKRGRSLEGRVLRDSLAATRDLETVFGRVSFSPRREAIHKPVLQQFKDGKLTVVQ